MSKANAATAWLRLGKVYANGFSGFVCEVLGKAQNRPVN